MRDRPPAEALPIGLFVLWSLVPLAILFGHVGGGVGIGAGGRVFTGADVLDVPDQLQYLAWARDAGDHRCGWRLRAPTESKLRPPSIL